jgi:hypothetical protein
MNEGTTAADRIDTPMSEETTTATSASPQVRKRLLRLQLRNLAIIALSCYLLTGLLLHSPVYTMVALRPIGAESPLFKIPSIINIPKQELKIATVGGAKLDAWYFKAPGSSKVVIVNHGNAGNLLNRLFIAKSLLQSGVSVIIYDYRGYGRSEGALSLAGLKDDALAVYDYTKDKLGYQPQQIVLYGESIGGGISSRVAEQRKVAGIIMHSPFTSLPNVAQDGALLLRLYPDWAFPQPDYENLSYVRGAHPPLLILYGDKDHLVPPAQSHRLFTEASQPKTVVMVPGAGHNDMIDVNEKLYNESIDAFLRKLP